MQKLIVFTVAICVLVLVAFCGGTSEANDELKRRVVPLSHVQWQSVKDQVSTNGYCHIKEQNVVLVITNGCPNVEHLLPVWNVIPEADLERNKLRIKGRRGDKAPWQEPLPYIGQG